MTRVVQLDGLVLLQIISHCSVRAPEAVAGTLLGLQLDDTLEVTHSFALPQELGGPGEGEKCALLAVAAAARGRLAAARGPLLPLSSSSSSSPPQTSLR